MPREKRRERVNTLLEQLLDALTEEEVEDAASMRVSLLEIGVDADRVAEKGKRLFSDFLKRQRLARAQEKLEHIRTVVRGFTRDAAQSLLQTREELARAFAGHGDQQGYLAYHRKLQSVEEEDIKSLGDDAALLRFIQDMEEDEEQE